MKMHRSHKWLVLALAVLAVPLLGGTPVSAAQPSITLSSGSAPPTGKVSVKGIRGFQSGEQVELYFDSTDADYTTATSTGTFGFTAINVPTSAAPGLHSITAVGRTSGASAQASVFVTGSWPMAGQTATGERFNETENVISRKNASSLQPNWHGDVTGAAATPVIGYDDVRRAPIAIVTSTGGTIAAFDAQGCGSATCSPLWTGDAGGPAAGSAVISGPNVIVATTDGTVASFALTGCGSATCSPQWTGSAGGAVDDSPTVAHDDLGPGRDLILVGTESAKIAAFDATGCGAATCSPAWSSSVTGGAVKVSPVAGLDPVSNVSFVFVVSQGYVSAFNLHTGAPKWKKPMSVDPGTRPAYAPNVFQNMGLLFIVINGQLQALKGQNGAPKWTSNDTAGDRLISSPTVSISRVYVASATQVYAYDAGARRCSSCHSIWRGSTPNANTDPSVSNGVVYEGTTDGRVLGFIASGCVKLAGDCTTPVYSSGSVGSAVTGLTPMVNGNLYVPTQGDGLRVLSLASPPQPPSAPNPANLTPIAGPIRHVVIIDQENHSFDEVFGYMCVNELQNACDGATTGKLLNGSTIPLAQATDIIPSVSHNNVAQTNAINGGLMNGFEKVSGCQQKKGYKCYTQFHPDQIPSLADLARNYVISDRTFQTEITATFGSHMLLGSGTLDGFTGDFPQSAPNFPAGPGWGCDSLMDGPWKSSPGAAITLVPSCVPSADGAGPYKPSPVNHVGPTLMDRMDAAGLSWKIYEGSQLWSNGDVWSICPTFADCLFSTQSANVTQAMDVTNDGAAGSLPNVSLVMPRPGGYSQHNGTSMMKGDNWISQVVSSIMNGPDWKSTAIFITYDDCGCFYDHVAPPAGRGERLPMVIVSPYAKPQFVDHGSTGMVGMLSYIEHRFGIQPLTTDDATAYDYSNSFDYNQQPLAPIPLTQHTVPAASIAYLKENPPTLVDPV